VLGAGTSLSDHNAGDEPVVNRQSDTIAAPGISTRKIVAQTGQVSVEPLMRQFDQGLPNCQTNDVCRPEA
jgi:hypothetical protein